MTVFFFCFVFVFCFFFVFCFVFVFDFCLFFCLFVCFSFLYFSFIYLQEGDVIYNENELQSTSIYKAGVTSLKYM